MASNRGLRGAAGQIFKLQKSGDNVPPAVRGAARRILEGGGTDADARAVRNHLGISRGGGSALKRASRNVQGAIGDLAQLGGAVDSLLNAQNAGRATGTSQLQFVKIINDKFESILEAKGTKKAAMVAGRILSKIGIGGGAVSGLKMVYSLERMARLGGAMVNVAAAGQMIAEGYLQREKNSAAARGRMIDKGRAAYGQNELKSIREQSHAMDVASASTTFFEHMLGVVGMAPSVEEKAEKIFERRAAANQKARGNPIAFGVDAAEAIAAYSEKIGIRPGDMTAEEKAAAVDDALRGKITGAALVPEGRITSELYTRNLRDTPERRAQIRDELRARQIESRVEQGELAEAAAKRRKTGKERYEERERLEYADATFRSHLSRHKAWSND